MKKATKLQGRQENETKVKQHQTFQSVSVLNIDIHYLANAWCQSQDGVWHYFSMGQLHFVLCSLKNRTDKKVDEMRPN